MSKPSFQPEVEETVEALSGCKYNNALRRFALINRVRLAMVATIKSLVTSPRAVGTAAGAAVTAAIDALLNSTSTRIAMMKDAAQLVDGAHDGVNDGACIDVSAVALSTPGGIFAAKLRMQAGIDYYEDVARCG